MIFSEFLCNFAADGYNNTDDWTVAAPVWHDVGLGLRFSDERRDVGAATEVAARICVGRDGGGVGVVAADSGDGDECPFPTCRRRGGFDVGAAGCRRFLLGMGFLLLIDELTPHLHIGTDKPEGPRSHLSRTAMLVLAVTIHNLPEGMAVGVVFAGAETGIANISLARGIAVSLGIAIQNIPEGAIISMPMRAAGNSKWKSFLIGSLSGAVEPIGAVAVLLLASLLMPALPYMLAFAAGAMLYVVVEELIPEASNGRHSNLSTIGFAIGFVLMMVLDVVMG